MDIATTIQQYDLVYDEIKFSLLNFDYFSTVYKIKDSSAINETYARYFNEIRKMSTDRLIIDVGANVGIFAVPLAKLGYKLIAFEPVKLNYELLIQNIENNKVTNLVSCYNLALLDVNENRTIYVPYCEDNSSFDCNVAVSNMNTKEYEEELVICLTFDDFCLKQNIDIESIGFVKIDVQGFEYNVICGMVNTLKKCRDIKILLEWDDIHTRMCGNSLTALSNLLLENGFAEIKNLGDDRIFYKS